MLNVKKLLKILLVSVLLASGTSINIYAEKANQTETKSSENKSCSCELNDLLDNFKDYTTTNVTFHAGDLYQHSIWTVLAVNQCFENHESLVEGLSARDRELVVFTALLHDIGKAGDLDYVFYTKPGHEIKGLEYLTRQKTFYLTQNKTFDFVRFFESLGIAEEEVKVISILVGAHNLLGALLRKLPVNIISIDELSNSNPELDEFFVRIKDLFDLVGYKNKLDLRLLKLIILICLADVKGSKRVSFDKPIKIFDFTIQSSPDEIHLGCPDNFTRFGYDSRGQKICERLLDFEK